MKTHFSPAWLTRPCSLLCEVPARGACSDPAWCLHSWPGMWHCLRQSTLQVGEEGLVGSRIQGKSRMLVVVGVESVVGFLCGCVRQCRKEGEREANRKAGRKEGPPNQQKNQSQLTNQMGEAG